MAAALKCSRCGTIMPQCSVIPSASRGGVWFHCPKCNTYTRKDESFVAQKEREIETKRAGMIIRP